MLDDAFNSLNLIYLFSFLFVSNIALFYPTPLLEIFSFLDRHRPCRSHNSLIGPDDDDDPDDCLSSFFASFFQDLVLARVSSR